jgi:minor extracellular serine protease Vpr
MVRKSLLLLVAALLLLPVAAFAAPAGSAGDYVIVTLKSKPLASYDGGVAGLAATKPVRGKLDPSSPAYKAYAKHLANERANYRAFLQKNAPRAEIVREYSVVLNGFALKLNGAKQSALTNANVRAVGNSWLYKPTMTESVDIINAIAGWEANGGRSDAGSGIKIGIIDTGIDESHDFFDCKGDITNKVYASGKAFDPSNVLVFDHGTHVAGTAAGCVTELPNDEPIEGFISGVAPGAALYDYNVFPGFGSGYVAFGGSAFSHDIAAALEDAVADGMDVVNMSLGGTIQGPHDFLAEASNATVDAGVVVATSAGNEGPGAGTIGSPGNAANVIASGATTNNHYIGVPVVTPFGTFGGAVGDFDPFADSPVTNAPFRSWGGDELACTATTTDFTGFVVLIKRGTCTFATKVANAAAADAIGVVVYNNAAGDPTAMGGAGEIPAVMVSLSDGEAIKGQLPSTVSIDGNDPEEFITGNYDIIAGFSSRGPGDFLYNVKPDVVAPGVNIYSSVFENGWAMFQGTSMASPHTAGAAALLLDANSALMPADVKSLLGNNADRDVWASTVNGPTVGVLARGGGRIDVERALSAGATFDPMSLSFGRHTGSKQVNVSIEVTVKNLTGSETTYSISEDDDNLQLSTDSLTLQGGQTGTFTVSLSARGAEEGDGDVTVSDGTNTYLIPLWYSTGNTAR